jgi:thiamine biosynthesis lipoprotein
MMISVSRVLFLSSFLLLSACFFRSPQTVFGGLAMGTSYTVKIVGQADSLELKSQMDALLESLNKQMSLYGKDTDIIHFNESSSNVWFSISPEFARMVEIGLDISRLSNGAFDMTVKPLVSLWGFGPEGFTKVPSDKQIKSALKKIGYTHLEVRDNPPAIRKDIPEITLDMGGIAQGLAVDLMAELLEKKGYSRYMVEFGGEIRAKGLNADNVLWRIGIVSPVPLSNEIGEVVPLKDMSVSTSGDYRNYKEIKGQRFSHTIDPSTGRPITHKLASVSIFSKTCLRADALSTALMVMGPDNGLEFANAEGIAAYFIIHDEKEFIVKMTKAFEIMMKELNTK